MQCCPHTRLHAPNSQSNTTPPATRQRQRHLPSLSSVRMAGATAPTGTSEYPRPQAPRITRRLCRGPNPSLPYRGRRELTTPGSTTGPTREGSWGSSAGPTWANEFTLPGRSGRHRDHARKTRSRRGRQACPGGEIYISTDQPGGFQAASRSVTPGSLSWCRLG